MSERSTSPNVYGIETEYSCLLTLPNDVVYEIVGSCHSIDAKLGLYVEPEAHGSYSLLADETDDPLKRALKAIGIDKNSLGMLSNGGRLYIDLSGPEYATPETATAEDVVHRTFEGDQLLLNVFEKLVKEEVISGYQINRKVVDHNRTSRGVHLNTLTKLANKKPSEKVGLWLATLNVAKGALFGSGGLLVNEDGDTEYHHSPRLSVTDCLFAYYTDHSNRPLVRIPFKEDGNRLARIETITSDALNFGWPIRASIIATNAVVGLIELGYGDKLPILRPADSVASALNVGRYGSEGIMYLESGGKLVRATSLDVLRRITELVFEVDHRENHLDKETDQVLGEIIDIADGMDKDPYSVADQVESMARLVALERKMEKDGLPIDSEKICRFDYAWDWVSGGIAERLRSKGRVGWLGFSNLPTPSDTKHRLITPPKETRAKVRGEMIGKHEGEDCSDWSNVYFGSKARYVHPLYSQVPEQTIPVKA